MVQSVMPEKRLEISFRTIIYTVLFLVALGLLWTVRDIIVLFFLCFILMEAINPTVVRLEKLKIPRILGILIVYIVLLGVLIFAFANIIPVMVDQTSSLVKNLPEMIQNINIFGFSAADFSSQLQILDTLPANIANIAVSIV